MPYRNACVRSQLLDAVLLGRPSSLQRTFAVHRYLLARCCVITVLLSPLPALSGELWLSGFDPVIRSVVEPGMVSDYFDIFDPDASWYRAASRVRVFKIAGALALSGSEQKLLRLFADLQRRHISLALEISALTARGGCGEKIDGYAPSGELARMVERIPPARR